MTRTKLATVIAVCGLALGLATVVACGSSATPALSVTYTEADNLKSVTGTVGKTVAVELNEDRSSGYQWTAVVTPGIKIVRTTYTAPATAASATMTAGLHTWVLEYTQTGAQEFSATYAKGSPTTQGIPQYQLTVDVK